VANISKTLRINFYQNRSSINVEVMMEIFWCAFMPRSVYIEKWQCHCIRDWHVHIHGCNACEHFLGRFSPRELTRSKTISWHSHDAITTCHDTDITVLLPLNKRCRVFQWNPPHHGGVATVTDRVVRHRL